MMGNTKLSTIAEELRRKLVPAGEDPVRWLEEQIHSRRQKQGPSKNGVDVYESLLQLLKSPAGAKARTRASEQESWSETVRRETYGVLGQVHQGDAPVEAYIQASWCQEVAREPVRAVMDVEFAQLPEDVLALQKHLLYHSRSGRLSPFRAAIWIVFSSLMGLAAVVGLAKEGPSFWAFAVLATSLMVIGSVLFWRRLALRQAGKNLRKQVNPRLFGPRRLSLSPGALTVTTKEETTSLRWHAVEKIAVTDEHAFFYTSGNSAVVLPRRCFDNEEAFHEFVEKARQYRDGPPLSRRVKAPEPAASPPDEDTRFKAGGAGP